MIRGTTPTLAIPISFDTSLISEFYLTFSQLGEEVFTKEIHQCQIAEGYVYCKLTQEDTLKLKCHCNVKIQSRCKLATGDTLASREVSEPVEGILMEGEI